MDILHNGLEVRRCVIGTGDKNVVSFTGRQWNIERRDCDESSSKGLEVASTAEVMSPTSRR